MVETLEKLDLTADQLVENALAGQRPRDVARGMPVVEIHIAETLTRGFAREIIDLQLDLFEQFKLPTRPVYLRTGCIVLGLVVDPVDDGDVLRAYEALQKQTAAGFIAKHRIRKIALKNLMLPLPPNVNPSGRQVGICNRRLAYV